LAAPAEEPSLNYAEADRLSRQPREPMKLQFSYSMGFGTGDLHDFISEPSFRGFDFNVLWPIFRSLHIGPTFSHSLFYEERARETYEVGTSAVTAKLYNYTDYWSTSLLTRYYFLRPDAIVRPYAGVRLGIAALLATTLVTDYSSQWDPVGFYLAPDIGAIVQIVKPVSASISYIYNFSTASAGRFENLSFGSLQFGIVVQWPQ
jgi:hypothetical protein